MPKLTVANATTADRERAVEPGKTALLSIDMQNGEYSDERVAKAREDGMDERHLVIRLADTVIPNQQRLQAAARKAGLEVIYTVIEALTQDGRDISPDHKISGIFYPRGDWGAKPIDLIGPEGDEIVIPKTASGIFNSTNFEYVLRNLGVEYLVIYGICTEQCVETSVRDACDRGFLVTLVPDCCATHDADRHDRSIEAMDGHYARVRSTAELIAEFEGLGQRSAAS